MNDLEESPECGGPAAIPPRPPNFDESGSLWRSASCPLGSDFGLGQDSVEDREFIGGTATSDLEFRCSVGVEGKVVGAKVDPIEVQP